MKLTKNQLTLIEKNKLHFILRNSADGFEQVYYVKGKPYYLSYSHPVSKFRVEINCILKWNLHHSSFFYNMFFRQPDIVFDSGFYIIQIKIYKICKIRIQTQILL